jgi:hypothetical protein
MLAITGELGRSRSSSAESSTPSAHLGGRSIGARSARSTSRTAAASTAWHSASADLTRRGSRLLRSIPAGYYLASPSSTAPRLRGQPLRRRGGSEKWRTPWWLPRPTPAATPAPATLARPPRPRRRQSQRLARDVPGRVPRRRRLHFGRGKALLIETALASTSCASRSSPYATAPTSSSTSTTPRATAKIRGARHPEGHRRRFNYDIPPGTDISASRAPSSGAAIRRPLRHGSADTYHLTPIT